MAEREELLKECSFLDLCLLKQKDCVFLLREILLDYRLDRFNLKSL